MSPLRWDVLGVALLLALPLLALGLRGDLTTEEVTVRLPWCLLAGYLVVALLRLVARPTATGTEPSTDAPAEGEPTPSP